MDANYDDLVKSRSAPFYSTGEEISSPAIRNEFGWFHPYLRPALNRARPVDGLYTSPSKLIPLTFIAGIYGTNFEFVPELHYRYSYFIFWGVLILVGVLMLRFFKRKDWL